MLPPCDATATAQKAQITQSMTEPEQLAFREAMSTARSNAKPLNISMRDVKSKLSLLRVGAQPGGSAFRNDVLKAVGEVKGGADSLRRWAQGWASGDIPPCIVALVVQQVVRPVKKESGKPRNISLLECLFKFASGVTQHAIRRGKPHQPSDHPEGLRWDQYGGQPAGPELMLMVHQGLMRLRPDLAYCSLDAENAFPEIKRAAMLQGTDKWYPQHSNFLTTQWSAANDMWIETQRDVWDRVHTAQGTAQGDTASAPAFSRGLRVAIEESEQELESRGIWVHLPSLVDDMLLVTNPDHVDEALDVLKASLQRIGLKLNLTKCACYIPAHDNRNGISDRVKTIPCVKGGLPALGCAYSGEYATTFAADAVAAEPARKRLELALKLARECAEFQSLKAEMTTYHAAWHILQSVVAKALVYDVRTLEPETSLPLAAELDEAVAAAARELLGVCHSDGWTAQTTRQLQWGHENSGMAFGSAEKAARVGRIATIAQCLPAARQHLRKILPDEDEAAILEAIPLGGVQQQLKWLKETWAIEIGVTGDVAKEKEPRWNPSANFEPHLGLMGKLMQAMQSKERTAYLTAHSKRKQEAAKQAQNYRHEFGTEADKWRAEAEAHCRSIVRLNSAGGQGVHEWVSQCPSTALTSLNDNEVVFAIRWRLGLPVMSEGQCQLRSQKDRDEGRGGCGKPRDPLGDHALLCGKGPGRYRSHNAVTKCLARQSKQAGLEAVLEEVCPELLQGEAGTDSAVEARLDIHVWGSGMTVREDWIDVTITHPARKQMKEKAATLDRAGVAAEDAEERKRKRYGTGLHGVSGVPFGLEVWGRLGHSVNAMLKRLLSQVSENSGSSGGVTRKRWRAELGCALYRAMAATAQQASKYTSLEAAPTELGLDSSAEEPSSEAE